MFSVRTVARCLIVPALMLSSTAALAQSRATYYLINVKNETSSCAWITITAPPGGKGLGGTLSNWEQVKGDGKERLKTGPLWVAGGGTTYTFNLPMRTGFRVRAEVQKTNCASGLAGGSDVAGGTIYDTSITLDDASTGATSAYVSLKKGNGNYYFQR